MHETETLTLEKIIFPLPNLPFFPLVHVKLWVTHLRQLRDTFALRLALRVVL